MGNEPFERRVRERMLRVAEQHGSPVAARVGQQDAEASASEPQPSAEVVHRHTGRTWEQWRAVIEDWPGRTQGHAAVASWLQDVHGVPGWWAQAVTVGWERMTGRRLLHQRADGTFTANRSATLVTDPSCLGSMLRDRQGLAHLFPGLDPVLRSRAGSKNVRIALVRGVAEIAVVPKDERRTTVTVAHTKLPSPEAVAYWKARWADWLRALERD